MSDEAIKKFVDDLFTSGSGEEADRLVMFNVLRRNLGGWSRLAVEELLRKALAKESPRAH